MKVRIDPSWGALLQEEFEQPYFAQLVDFVKRSYREGPTYPPAQEIFRALDLCTFDKVRVVILGQDPYHGHGQANGLCFSVREQVRIPPSLVNIFKELHNDLGKPMPKHGNLERWAVQGVLLLNATLTVAARKPGSHQRQGWERFTDQVVKLIATQKEHVVFILWGAYAQQKGGVIDPAQHLVLTAPHPSPFSADRGFFGSKPFSQANTYLQAHGLPAIDW